MNTGRIVLITGAARGMGALIVVRFLASPDADFMSGQTLNVHGGETCSERAITRTTS